MDIFRQSQLSHKFTLERRYEQGPRGNVWLVTTKDDGAKQFLLRMYKVASYDNGVNPVVLRQSQGASLCTPYLVHMEDMEYVFTCNSLQQVKCQTGHILILSEMLEAVTYTDVPDTWVSSVLHALEYLHRHCYVHRRLTFDSLFRNGPYVKLGDFADVLVSNAPMTNGRKVFNHPYQAPEVLVNYEHYTAAADMWSFGVMLYQWIYQEHPFCDACAGGWLSPGTEDPGTVLTNIFNKLGTPDTKWRETYTRTSETTYAPVVACELKFPASDHSARARYEPLIKACLKIDPKARISALNALKMLALSPGKECKGKSVGFKPSIGPKGPLREQRRILIHRVGDEVQAGRVNLELAALALHTFDRVSSVFRTDLLEGRSSHGEIDADMFVNLYITCYGLATKLMHDVNSTADVFTPISEILRGALTPEIRISILYMERIIINHLRYDFQVEKISCKLTSALRKMLRIKRL